jgi:hypothetical protein
MLIGHCNARTEPRSLIMDRWEFQATHHSWSLFAIHIPFIASGGSAYSCKHDCGQGSMNLLHGSLVRCIYKRVFPAKKLQWRHVWGTLEWRSARDVSYSSYVALHLASEYRLQPPFMVVGRLSKIRNYIESHLNQIQKHITNCTPWNKRVLKSGINLRQRTIYGTRPSEWT